MLHHSFDQVFILTKCHPPRVAEQRVLRRDLFRKLTQALTCKLTIITAPAGYGKTTAIVDWLSETKLPVAWLSLDVNDNNPESFWRYLSLALDGAQSGIADATSYCLSSPELLKTNAHLNILIDRLNGNKHETILVLDDFHFIALSEILTNFSYLINYLPPHVHVILISRTKPRLELAKLKLGGNLLQIDLDDLRFQTEEIDQFYRVKGLVFEREEIDRIEQYSQGWAAVLVAVAMDPEARYNPERFDLSGRFDHSGQWIDRFLEEELVGKWSEEKRDFLLKTAILENLCGPLCDAVTGLHDSDEMLRQLWFQNEFLVALDDENRWYRYHPLFNSFLRKMLVKQVHPSYSELHLKAAHWHRENGLIYPAIDHYLQAGRFDTALELINSQVLLLYARGEFSRLFAWLDRLPEDLIRNHFEIIAVQMRYHTDNNLFDEAEKCLERMRELANQPGDSRNSAIHHQRQKGVLLQEAYLWLCRGNLTEFLTRFKAATEIDTADSMLSRHYMDFNLSEICLYRCKPGLGFINLFKSDPQAFQRLWADYRKMIAQFPGFGPLIVGEFYYETNRQSEALPYLATAIDEAVKAECPGVLVPAMVYIARIKRASNEIQAAFEAVRECEKRLARINRPHWNYLLNAFKTRLCLDVGRTEPVDEWLLTSKLHIYQDITKAGEYELLVFARVLMSRERFGDAAILLQRLITFAEDEKRLHSLVEILNLLAITAFQTGDRARALELLEKSLTIGLRNGYFRSFTDESAPIAALLGQFLLWMEKRKSSADGPYEQLNSYTADLLTTIRNSPFKTAFMLNEPPARRAAVKCFGSFAIYRDGHPVNCKNSKVREILAYLVHHQGNGVGWEKIVEAVWPNCSYEKAHHNFHMTMHLLRKFLKSHSLLEILDNSRGNYRIRPEMLDCDMYEFSRILSENKHRPSPSSPLSEAVRRLYSGGYLEEDGFAWAFAKAAKLEMMYREFNKYHSRLL